MSTETAQQQCDDRARRAREHDDAWEQKNENVYPAVIPRSRMVCLPGLTSGQVFMCPCGKFAGYTRHLHIATALVPESDRCEEGNF